MQVHELDDLLRRSQRVILSGRNYGGRIEWVCDVITIAADGHDVADQAQRAIEGAVFDETAAREG